MMSAAPEPQPQPQPRHRSEPSPATSPASATADDGALMVATATGDRDAFTRLVERHKDALVGYLMRLTGRRERAEDLAQEAFLRLFQTAHRYREQGNFTAYLYRIATNLLRSEARRERRFRLLEPFLRRRDAVRPEAAARVLRREAKQRLEEAVVALPLSYRVPLVLHELEGWAYRDIAEQLGCRVGTIKSRIHRARQKLKDELTPYWLGEPTWTREAELKGETP